MNNIFDFIIFEHSGLRNHFVDLTAIGRMLVHSGYRVGIADVTKEETECMDSGLPIVHISAREKAFKNKNKYLKAVIEELSPQTKNFYVGSILSSTDLSWLRFIPAHQKVFLWALRSFFFTSYKRFELSRHYPAQFFYSLRNRWITRRMKNVCFFVSEPIIAKELTHLGYKRKQMVIRPERITNAYEPGKSEHSNPLSLLAIGALREEKRIDLCIDALDELGNDSGIHLTIAGKAYSIHGYDRMLEKRSAESSSVTRISRRLSDKEYHELISQTDYLMLCDEKQPGCVTNGTMAEALLAGRPIIAPNYNPYKYVVEKYGVGILYELHNRDSFKSALLKAKSTNPRVFVDGLRQYQTDHMGDKVISDFSNELSIVLNNGVYEDE